MKQQFKNIKPYKVASHRIWDLTAEEKKEMLKLDWNEATIPPSPMVGEALRQLVKKGDFYNLYPKTINGELMHALSEYVKLPTENIQYFASSDSLHEYIAQMYINDGDKVTIVWPSYDNFRLTAEINGAEIDFYRFNRDFTFDENDFMQHLEREKPVIVYICNPNNPTGYLWNVEYIERVVSSFPEIMFIIDEAYSEFTRVSAKDLVLSYENIIISRTMSKAFALANFRFGYMLSSEQNVANVNTIRNPKNITTFSQVAAIAALHDLEYMNQYVDEVNLSKEEFAQSLSEIEEFKIYARNGNFILIILQDNETKQNLIRYLDENNIMVRDLSQDESVKNAIRITIGTRSQMQRVARIMKNKYI